MVDVRQSERALALLHRRPAYAVNAPGLLRHRCYRVRNLIEAPSVELAEQHRQHLIAGVNFALRAIQEQSDATPCWLFHSRHHTPKPHERQIGTGQTMLVHLPTIDPDLVGWRARICVDMHGEYYSVTYILDQSKPEPRGSRRHEAQAAAPTSDGVDLGADLFRSVARELSHIAAMGEKDAAAAPRQYRDYRRYLDWWYREVWERFDRHAFETGCEFPGELFAEFYGVAMQTSGPTDIIVDPAARHDPIIWPRVRDEESRLRPLYRWVNDNRDFLRGALHLDPTDDGIDRDANCVLCTMLWGSAVYGSSLGRPLPATDNGARAAPAPLHYFVISHGWSKYLLGRILRRLHALGELRSAAILDLEGLDRASDQMRALRNEIDDSLHTRDPEHNSATLEHDRLRAIQGKLNEIADSRIDGGLLQRVSRSRYYTQDFKQRMEDMGFGHIDGWEPYDVFMHRNLFKTLEYIDGIGTRFEDLAATVQRLTAARNLHEVAEVEKDIAYIQSIGEIIGWTAFAYYGSHVLSLVIYPLCTFFSCSAAWCDRFHDHQDALTWSAGIMIPIAILLGVAFRNRWFSKLFRRRRRRH